MNQNNPILVKFTASENFISIRTITRRRKSPLSFILSRERFAQLEDTGDILVKDGYSFAQFRLIESGKVVRIDFTWLSVFINGTVKGYTETVKLDYDRLANWIAGSLKEDAITSWSMYYSDRTSRQPRMDFSSAGAQKTIREILSVPVLRHKLTRAVRDNFQWPHDGDCVICFYSDWDKYSFSFREFRGGKAGICGGLILHRTNDLEKAYYSVHT